MTNEKWDLNLLEHGCHVSLALKPKDLTDPWNPCSNYYFSVIVQTLRRLEVRLKFLSMFE